MFRALFVLFTFISPLLADPVPTTAAPSNMERNAPKQQQLLDLKKVFGSAPLIYSLLFFMSSSSIVLWLYTLATFRSKEIMPHAFVHELRKHLELRNYEGAQNWCRSHQNLLSSIMNTGLVSRKHGPQVMIDAMKSEGKRASASLWQRLSLLNDIAIVAPMLGLLGTVIGMFYAFYDVNRSIESINALFDGLGVAVGTTVAGLIVAILSMMFATTLKYRLIKKLGQVENEALILATQIES